MGGAARDSRARAAADPGEIRRLVSVPNLVILGAVLLLGAHLYASISHDPWRIGGARLGYAALIVLLLLGLGLGTARKSSLALALASFSVGLYLAEAVLRLSKGDVYIAAAERAGVSFDRRTRLEVAGDLKTAGVSAFPIFNPVIEVGQSFVPLPEIAGSPAFPLAGLSNATLVLCNEGGEWVVVQTDRYGFHNPDWVHDGSSMEVAAIGDSFTFGYCVQSGANIVAHLRRRFPRTINLGYGGNGPLAELATIREYVEPLQPRVVLWFYFEGNDFWDLGHESGFDILMRYQRHSDYRQDLRSKQAEIDHWVTREIDRRSGRQPQSSLSDHLDFALLEELRSRIKSLVGAGHPYVTNRGAAPDLALFESVLRASRDEVSSWGGRLYFVYLPAIERLRGSPFVDQPSRNRVLMLAAGLSIPVIDLTTAFESHPDPLSLFFFGLSGHYNEFGHELVARTIVPIVEQTRGTDAVSAR